jgi:hypothetical protein
MDCFQGAFLRVGDMLLTRRVCEKAVEMTGTGVPVDTTTLHTGMASWPSTKKKSGLVGSLDVYPHELSYLSWELCTHSILFSAPKVK